MASSIPSPNADECIRSFLDRTARLGGQLKSGDAAGDMLRKVLNALKPEERNALIAKHSYLGYLRFVNQSFAGVPVTQHSDLLRRNCLLRSPISRERICPACQRKDSEVNGIPHVRRYHQLVGVEACMEHNVPLLEQSKSAGLTMSSSGDERLSGVERTQTLCNSENAVIRRFVRLSLLTLNSVTPRSPAFMAKTLTQRSRTQGVRVTIEGHGHRLSDLARDSLPERWLAVHFPAIHRAKHDAHSPALDDVLRARHVAYKTASYLLAMALLWDVPEEAMKACTEPVPQHRNLRACDGGMRALDAVLRGMSIKAACRAERTTMAALADAIRAKSNHSPGPPGTTSRSRDVLESAV